MDEHEEAKMPWTRRYSRKSATGKEFVELLVSLFASTPDLSYSSEALLAMAQRFQELLAGGVSEELLIAHCRDQLADFSQKLIRGTRGRGKGSVLLGPAVIDATLILSIFRRCPWPVPPGPIFTTRQQSRGIGATSAKKPFAGQRKAGRKA